MESSSASFEGILIFGCALAIAGFCYYQFGFVNPRRMEESLKKSQENK